MSRSTPSPSDALAQQRLQEALHHFQAGDTTRAEAMSKSILRAAPQFEAAHVLLARAQRVQGFNKHALQSCKAGIKVLPKSVPLLIELALIHRAAGRTEEAEATYRLVLVHEPRNAMAMHNLGNLQQARGALSEAEAAYRQVLGWQPQMAVAHFELGNVFAAREEHAAALSEWQQAVQLQPQLAPAWFKLATALEDLDHAKAIDALHHGLRHDPNNAAAMAQLGKLLCHAGRGAEAEQCARMAIGMDAKLPMAHYVLGLAQRVQGHLDAALAPLDTAARTSNDGLLTCEATYLQALCQIDQGRFTDGLHRAELLLAMSQTPQQQGMAHHVIGSALFDAGRVTEARQHFAQAVRLSPQHAPHRVSLVATALYVDTDDGQAHRTQATDLLGSLTPPLVVSPSLGEKTGRKPRIGWLSADFRLHSCAFFLEPLLSHLRPEAFDLYAYDTGSRQDAVMARFQALIPHWRSVESLSPQALAQCIADDEIDVLVDLAGLTTGGRIEALAASPAPVQLSWLGYLGTCGLPNRARRLTDRWVDGPQQAAGFVEQAMVLDRPYVCYQAPADAPDVQALPMLERGHPTFGSFNALSKLSDQTVALWSAVLRAVPNARLLLKTKVLSDDAVKQHTLARFAAHGIAANRLELMGWAPHVSHHLALYHQVDVALDTFPYNGVTTTCEALWMGVPVVSLVGQTVCSRQGRTLLNAVGLPELACENEAQVVQRCVDLVGQAQALAELRARLRERMAASPLCDAADMARAFEGVILSLLPAH